MGCVSIAAAGVVTAALLARPVAAGTLQYPLGQQDFMDGAHPVFTTDIKAAGAGEPAPFDGSQFGDDRTRALGEFSYTHGFFFSGPAPVSATLTVGILDVDSFPGDKRPTMRYFLDGVEQPGDAFTHISNPDSNSSAEVVTVSVPLHMLSDGLLDVTFEAKRSRKQRSFRGAGNAIAPDFSVLSLTFDDVTGPNDEGTNGPDDGNNGPIPKPNGPDNGGGGGNHAVPLPPAVIPGAVVLATLMGGRVLRRIRRP